VKEFLLDANVLVRFLVQDDPKQSAAATALFERAERHEVLLHLDGLAVAEALHVLIGRHGQQPSAVVNALLAIIQNAGVETAQRIRLGGHVWFLAPGREIMEGCVLQHLDHDGGAGQLNSGNGFWPVSTRVN